MGKHKGYNEDLRTSVVNALITIRNCGITKAESCSSVWRIQTACAWIMMKERKGILEDPHPVDQEKLMKGTIVTCVKCQKVMVRLIATRITSKYKLRKDVYVTTIHFEDVLVENH